MVGASASLRSQRPRQRGGAGVGGQPQRGQPVADRAVRLVGVVARVQQVAAKTRPSPLTRSPPRSTGPAVRAATSAARAPRCPARPPAAWHVVGSDDAVEVVDLLRHRAEPGQVEPLLGLADLAGGWEAPDHRALGVGDIGVAAGHAHVVEQRRGRGNGRRRDQVDRPVCRRRTGAPSTRRTPAAARHRPRPCPGPGSARRRRPAATARARACRPGPGRWCRHARWRRKR